jgi:hypothetical protein
MHGIGRPITSIQDKAVLREYAHALRDGNKVFADKIYHANTDLKGGLNTVKELFDTDQHESFTRFL